MIKIEEYIFYRTYIAYKQKNDPALFSSMMYLISIYVFLLSPLCGFILNLLEGIEGVIRKGIFIIYFSMIVIYIVSKYYKKSTLSRVLHTGSIRSKIMPTWFYFTILPMSMVLGITVHILVTKYIIYRFDLDGILYQFIK